MILVFESHPVQYRVPLYRRTGELLGGKMLKVIYGDDFSLRAYQDTEFGEAVAWQSDLASGYDFEVLHTLRDPRLVGFRALGGKGVRGVFERHPGVTAILLTSLRFELDWVALWEAKRRGIPVVLRMETQDAALSRNLLKGLLRSLIYRMAYCWVDQVLPIGELNATHYERHGKQVSVSQFVRYSVPNPLAGMSSAEKDCRRSAWREAHGIPTAMWLVGFVGKLIEKKDPELILTALEEVSRRRLGICARIGAVFVGAGPLEATLKERAAKMDCPVWFTGFLSQAAITDAYLAMDCLILPSRRQGETWGLVVNEALQAGCAVVISEAVGCSVEFGAWERVRVLRVGDAQGAASAVEELAAFDHDWDWCRERMEAYSLEVSASSLESNLSRVAMTNK